MKPRPSRPHRAPRSRSPRAPEGAPSEFASNRHDAFRNRNERRLLDQNTDARALAAQILLRVEQEGAFSDVLLDGVARRGDLSPTGKALTRQFVKGVLTNRTALDDILGERLNTGIDSVAPEILQILRIGSYQLLYLDRAPKPLVVNESVALARTVAGEGAARMTNAVLRRIVREQPSPTAALETLTDAEAIARATSHPRWVVDLWEQQLGREETIKLCTANNAQLPTALRVNTHRTTLNKLQGELARDGVITRPSTLAPDTLVVEKLQRGATIARLRAYEAGHFAVQDEGSILISHLLAPQPGEVVLDMCAAPGGKTVHLATLMKDTGTVLALDPSAQKLAGVRALAQRLGLKSVKTIEADGRTFTPREPVDAILIDAPCSGLGMVARKADLRWKRNESSLPELVQLQQELLNRAAQILKPGGRIVYSTCTINDGENRNQVATFLKQNSTFSLAHAAVPGDPSCIRSGYLQTFPHLHRTGGMFAARLMQSADGASRS